MGERKRRNTDDGAASKCPGEEGVRGDEGDAEDAMFFCCWEQGVLACEGALVLRC